MSAAAAAATPVHTPEVEARLGTLIGSWTRAGKESSYRDDCVWFDRRAFVVCSLVDSGSGTRVQAIVGYSKADGRFTYQNYGNDGSSRVQYGYPLGANGIVFTDEQTIGGKRTRLTTSMVPQADKRLQITLDRSVMGGAWEQAGQVYYVPRR
jgi:hypothetical protein